MDANRYNTWIAVWEWFETVPKSVEIEGLWRLLNKLWQEDRVNSTPAALAGTQGRVPGF
jgi:hypothetical protein